MSGGGGDSIGSQIAAWDAQGKAQQAPQAPGNPGGVDYTPVATPDHYSAQYAPQSASPFLQSVMNQHGTPLQQGNSLGLPSLQSMFGMQQGNAPYQSGIRQLAPMAPYMGSSYRPDMSGIAAKLNNVAPPVTYEQMHPTPVDDGGGGNDSGSGGQPGD